MTFRITCPLRVLPVTPTHRRVRLELCRTRGNWTAAEWTQVIFSDESRFNLSRVDNRVRVWRPSDERPSPVFALQRHTAPTTDNLVALHFKYDQARRRFVEWAQNEIEVVPDFHKRILFSDEAHFWLNGYVNKQNCRIWSEANPQVYVETPLHPEKLTVWCALWAGGIIGPYFFKNDEGHNVTVNGYRYRAMITNFFHS
ncbi:putative DD41D transposase [Trichonephila clavipes]|nr:putative DD41D transposase [Trichonephila clavipes]